MQEREKPRITGASQDFCSGANKPQENGKSKYHETRRNAAACFRTSKTTEPHYCGIMVVEGLKDGDKFWINVGVREIRSGKRAGQKYLSITLLPFRPTGGQK